MHRFGQYSPFVKRRSLSTGDLLGLAAIHAGKS
jgi:hypothetical protein